MRRPPLGVTPRYLWDEQRRRDLGNAIRRVAEADVPIPQEWVDEYNELFRKEVE